MKIERASDERVASLVGIPVGAIEKARQGVCLMYFQQTALANALCDQVHRADKEQARADAAEAHLESKRVSLDATLASRAMIEAERDAAHARIAELEAKPTATTAIYTHTGGIPFNVAKRDGDWTIDFDDGPTIVLSEENAEALVEVLSTDKPTAEAGEVGDITKRLRRLKEFYWPHEEGYVSAQKAADLLESQQATIAEQARRIEELEAELSKHDDRRSLYQRNQAIAEAQPDHGDTIESELERQRGIRNRLAVEIL